MRCFKQGDWVIFRKSKHSAKPGPRAAEVHPSEHGEGYNYLVDKFWAVVDLKHDGTVALTTRTGKQHVVVADHPNLRHATWWERLIYRGRFPQVT